MNTRLSRRAALAAFSALSSLALPASRAHAQAPSWPSRPIRFIVPVPAGGAADVMSRMVAEHLQARLGQPVVVENRPGAGSSVGMDVVAKAPPDGHVIGMGNVAANAINPAVRPAGFPYQPVKDFAAVSMVGVTPLVLVVNAQKIPVRSVAEFVAYLRANPGKVAYGSSGTGSSLHVGMELFCLSTRTSMVHVPYKGSAPMLTDLLSGEVQASMDAAATSWPHVQAGKLRALAVSTAERAFFAPDLPTIAETVPGFDVKPWHGVVAPAGTPAAIVNRLAEEIQAFLRLPATDARLRERGVVRVGNSPREFAQAMATDYELYQRVVKEAGIKAD